MRATNITSFLARVSVEVKSQGQRELEKKNLFIKTFNKTWSYGHKPVPLWQIVFVSATFVLVWASVIKNWDKHQRENLNIFSRVFEPANWYLVGWQRIARSGDGGCGGGTTDGQRPENWHLLPALFHLSSRCQHSDKLSFDPFPFWMLPSLGRHHHHHFHFQSDLLFWWLNQSDEQRCLALVLFLN